MKRIALPFLVVIALFLWGVPVHLGAQEANSYNLNTDHGLPSNKVYGMITDRYGYLWICTDNGVARYNGYGCKLFTQSEGLPQNDIWELLEDKKGRIWIGSLSDEMGYIFNNRYHKVYMKDIKSAIYPMHINLYDSGVFFSSSHINNHTGPLIFMDRNDTLLHIYLDDSLFGPLEPTYNPLTLNIGMAQSAFARFNSNIFRIENIKDAVYGKARLKVGRKMSVDKSHILDRVGDAINLLYGDWFLTYIPDKKSTTIYTLNIRSGVIDSFSITKYGIHEPIEYMNFNKAMFEAGIFIYTQRHVVQVFPEQGFAKSKVYSLDSIVRNDAGNIKTISFINDQRWRRAIGTTQQGVFMQLNGNEHAFVKGPTQFVEYKHIGVDNHLSFWWNLETRTLIRTDDGIITAQISAPAIRQINNIVHYSQDTCLVLGPISFCLNLKNNTISAAPRLQLGSNLMNLLPIGPEGYFVLTRRGFYRSDAPGNLAPNAEKKYVCMDLFSNIFFDSIRNKLWMHSANKIFIYDVSERSENVVIDKIRLADLGIANLEKVCVDGKFGNVYLKGAYSLVAWDFEKNTHKEILKNINLKNAVINLYDGTLVVAGTFGISFCKILGKQSISKPIIYYNTKGKHYEKVSDMSYAAQSRTVTLNTDKGMFHVALPAEREFYRKERYYTLQYNFVASNTAGTKNIHYGDTLIIEQNDRKLLLDVINPFGNGAVTYYQKRKEDSLWSKLNSNEINFITAYEPDHYYTLYFYASDDSWKSDVIKTIVYVRPFWWQTRGAKRLTWIGSSLFGLFIIFISVYITRRIVLRAATRKNLQMEMELKSIYAQINPHFIFNSLNSALLLVSKNKMDDAYMHISKFSRLLRSYLKSSRNKYITVAEEVENLKNYIELQQTRFKNKFDYQIVVGPLIYQQKLMIPSLLLQPFVENAINHGILLKEEKSNLVVEFMFNAGNNEMICVIDDDGIGRKQAKQNNVSMEGKTESYGNLMIKDLVNIFNRYEDMHIDIRYNDKEPPLTGTTVIITINRPHHEQ